jgi:outer membrane lipoprotein-sorting protein
MILFVLAGLLVGLQDAAALSEKDLRDVGRVENYLNELKTARARFVQIAPDGAFSEGEMALERPGRVRFEYKPPSPLLVVGDGIWLVIYDAELGQVSQVPMMETPLSILLDEEIRFGKRVVVDRVERESNVLKLVLIDTKRVKDGSMTLVFTEKPFVLRQWIVRDAMDQEFSIYLNDLELNPELEPHFFVFVDPTPFDDVHER